VRVLLDAHVPNRRVGRGLARAGHDVLALDHDETLSRLADEEVLALAAEQERIVVTHNVRHLVPIARRWAEARRSHHGLILVTSPSTEYGAIVRRLEQTFAERRSAANESAASPTVGARRSTRRSGREQLGLLRDAAHLGDLRHQRGRARRAGAGSVTPAQLGRGRVADACVPHEPPATT
jgi:hypothetical protein